MSFNSVCSKGEAEEMQGLTSSFSGPGVCVPDNLTLFHIASLSTSSYNSYLKVPQGALFSEVNNHIRGKTPTITGQQWGKTSFFPTVAQGSHL